MSSSAAHGAPALAAHGELGLYATLLRLAGRNVWRNSRRTLLTASAIMVCVSAIIVGRSLLNGVSSALIDAPTRSIIGHAQVHNPRYEQASAALPLALNLKWDDELRSLLMQDPEVLEAAGRIHFTALLTDSTQEKTAPCLGIAVEPARERQITTKAFEEVTDGRPVSEDTPEGVVVAVALAKSLGIQVGDEVSILTTTAEGTLGGRDVKVIGISHVPMLGLANKSVYMVLPTAQRLLRMEGAVTEIGLALSRPAPEQAQAFADRTEGRLREAGRDLSVRPWMEAAATYLNALAMWESVFSILVACFYAAMISGITNTVLINVSERTVEIGTMMAMGVKRQRIVRLFLLEALVMGLIGSAAGAVLALGLITWLGKTGINVGLAGELPDIVYPWIELHYPWMVMGVAMGITVAAALWPVRRISRLTPVVALAG